MSDKLVKELQSVKEDTVRQFRNSEDPIIKDVETLLIGMGERDASVLRNVGLDHQLEYVKKHEDDYNRTKYADKIYEAESYVGSQIRELCIGFDLRLLPAHLYNGSIPTDLARVIDNFAKTHELDIKQKDYYILAPAEQFKEEIRHVQVRRDPILFYRLPSGSSTTSSSAKPQLKDTFVQVHNWGNDFTDARRWKFMLNSYRAIASDVTIKEATIIGMIFLIGGFILGMASFMWASITIMLVGVLTLYVNAVKFHKAYRKWNEPKYKIHYHYSQ